LKGWLRRAAAETSTRRTSSEGVLVQVAESSKGFENEGAVWMRISLIVAMAENRVIGRGGSIPWKIPGEQKMFRRITLGHTLIMGRKTYEDIGRPLPDRLNIVISRRPDYQPVGCLKADSLERALALCPAEETEAFIIGGGELFRETIAMADRIYLTVVPLTVPGDTFFPEIPETFVIASSEHVAGPSSYALHIYERARRRPD
jgi:dihydrofolate reductase